MQPSVRFPDKLRLRTPKGLPRAIEVAAAARHTQPSEWARQALLRGLEADGLTLLPDGQVGSTPTGSLNNVSGADKRRASWKRSEGLRTEDAV